MSTRSNRLQMYPYIEPSNWQGRLNGKVAVITGASTGIGRETAKAFAAAGAKVSCIARRAEALSTLVAEIQQSGGQAVAIVADVTSPQAAATIVAQTESHFGPIDILINNAGISRISPFVEEADDLQIWWRVFEVNVRAPMQLTRAVLPSLLARNTGGLILTVGSSVMTLDLPVMTAYAASKAAIAKAHRALALELEGTGIRSFCVSPGMVRTELASPADAINRGASEHPLMKAFLDHIKNADETGRWQDVQVSANAFVALAAEEKFKVLNGKYFDTTMDLEDLLQHPESLK